MPASAYPSDERLIVGRERERQHLRAVLARVLDGHGALLLMSGEAGIGKTTLYNKLGVNSRTAAAAFAIREGLA